MNYQTVEVELDNGRIHPTGAERLPVKARALLTILTPLDGEAGQTKRTLGEALRGLNIKGRGEYTDLSTNKRHLDDLGK